MLSKERKIREFADQRRSNGTASTVIGNMRNHGGSFNGVKSAGNFTVGNTIS
jgi:hypothetical protein